MTAAGGGPTSASVGAAALAPYAARDDVGRGRQHAEPAPAYRSELQRDRDRIVHCGAFRRLEYKTQVFVNHEGDLFRTRLTHSLEVAQIARSVARALSLNEDLTEAIALAHDLGHTPFGHAGQDALNRCMGPYGGFEHNLQSLRVVDELEAKYPGFAGLNLTFETREGILKHCRLDDARRLGALGERFVCGRQPSLEAQLTNLADEIAYNNHDVDDGLRAGLIGIEDLRALALFGEAYEQVAARYRRLDPRRTIHQVVRHMINRQVVDLIETTRANLTEAAPADIEAIRAHATSLAAFSEGVASANRELKRFLRRNLYRHYRVQRMTLKAARVVEALFNAFLEEPALLPSEHQPQRSVATQERARKVADYIAGMTDRYAIAEHERLFNPDRVS